MTFKQVQLLASFVVAGSIFAGCMVGDRVVNSGNDSAIQLASYQQESSVAVEESKATIYVLSPNENLMRLVESAKGPVLIDFYADWCGPCKKMAQTLREIEPVARENEATIIKVNVDQHAELADEFQIKALPTLILVKDDAITQKVSGLVGRSRLESMLTR